MPARLESDPINIIIDIFNKRNPDKNAIIYFVEGLKEKANAFGETFWAEDDSVPMISIDIQTPYIGFIEVLAHELAHIAVGVDVGHGDEWEKEFTAINDEFNKKMEVING